MLFPQWTQVRYLALPIIFKDKFDVGTINRLLREWTGQSLVVDRNHLELVMGKLERQKNNRNLKLYFEVATELEQTSFDQESSRQKFEIESH